MAGNTRYPFEQSTSALYYSNDGRLRFERGGGPHDIILRDSNNDNVALFTRSRTVSDAFIAGYDLGADRAWQHIAEDTTFILPSGTESSVESALGDVARARTFFLYADETDQDSQGMAADLEHVAELIQELAQRARPAASFDALNILLSAVEFRREWLDDYGEREYGDQLPKILNDLDTAEAAIQAMRPGGRN